MKVGELIKPNAKGQIVIPKSTRDALGISDKTFLNLTLAGSGIYIYPVEEVLTGADSESSYLKLLQKTKGKWGKEKLSKNTSLELQASKNRKSAW